MWYPVYEQKLIWWEMDLYEKNIKLVEDRFPKYNQLDIDYKKLYNDLIIEEVDELNDARKNRDWILMMDAYIDIIWVHYGLLWAIKMPLLSEEHNEIMKKICDYERQAIGTLEKELHIQFYRATELYNLLFEEIIRSNYTKTPWLYDNNWKLMKWPKYSPPNLEDIIRDFLRKITQ